MPFDPAEFLVEALGGVAADSATRRLGSIMGTLHSRRVSQALKVKYLAAEAARMHPLLPPYLSDRLDRAQIMFGDNQLSMMRRTLNSSDLLIPTALVTDGTVELGELAAEDAPDGDWLNDDYLKMRRELGGVINDNICYAASGFEPTHSGVLINGSITTYGRALATLDSLEWELLHEAAQAIEKRAASPEAFAATLDARLKRRRLAESESPNWILRGGYPAKALGISTLLVYNDKGVYKIMVGKRSAATGAHADLYHVIPSGMFQPELGRFDREWNIQHGVLKEYGEELFDNELDTAMLDPQYFYQEWAGVRALRRGLDKGVCSLHVTGLVVNLYNLRPEICVLIMVHDEKWWAKQYRSMRHNWEYVDQQHGATISSVQGRAWTDLRLDAIEEQFDQYFGNQSGMWVPPGLAALWLGVDKARQIAQ
jgi:hypothetical protein